jgi:putative ABC transport system permease protein
MKEFFGLSMNYIMFALLILLGVTLAAVAWVMLRDRIMFMIGVRNIPRRRAQTLLIVVGLMLSTLIISSAFSVGDTFDYSITNNTYDRLHSIDEVVQAQRSSGDEAAMGMTTIVSPRSIPEGQARQFIDSFREIPGVDGVVGVIRAPVPVTNQRAGQSEPFLVMTGVAEDGMADFPDIESLDGRLLSIGDLGRDEIYLNKSAAEALDAVRGDALTFYIGGKPQDLVVREVVKDRELTGATPLLAKGLALGLKRAQELLGRPEQVDMIAVSNDGGVRDGLAGTDQVMKQLGAQLQGGPWRASDTKRASVEQATLASSSITTIFVIMGSFSIAAGMLLIFLIFVMLAAERKAEMGIARAVGAKRGQLIEMFLSEGMAYNVLAAAVGCALGVGVSVIMVRVMAVLFAAFNVSIIFHVTARSLIVSYSMGVVLTFATVTFSSWRVSKLNIVAAIRDISEPQRKGAGRSRFAIGVLAIGCGALFSWLGWTVEASFPFALGVMLGVVGAAFAAGAIGVPQRLSYSIAGLFVVSYWVLGAGGDLPMKDLSGGWEMFLLSGIGMIAASTYVLIYNSDLLLSVLSLPGAVFKRLMPPMITAVAYPMASRFRTGMTIAMIALVVFSLVVMATVEANFNQMFVGADALGGYDVIVQENPINPIADLRGSLQAGGFDTSAIAEADGLRIANRSIAQVRMAPRSTAAGDDFSSYTIYGLTPGFIQHNEIKLRSRARGLATDADVWRSLAERPDQAVIDAFSLPSDFAGTGRLGFKIAGVTSSETVFDPIRVQVRDAASGGQRDVEIVGVISGKASGVYQGLFLSEPSFTDVFARPESTLHFVKLREGADARAAAKDIEKALLAQGVQADSLRKLIDEFQSMQQAMIYLIEGFMGLGLLVGVAAVGVIAFRAVVERRQQIGMMRAIGFTREQVALSFVLESSFIAMLGALSGIALGLLLANRLLLGDSFDFGFKPTEFYVPWLEVVGVGVFTFVAAIVMTMIPSVRASSIPVAEAMRYE